MKWCWNDIFMLLFKCKRTQSLKKKVFFLTLNIHDDITAVKKRCYTAAVCARLSYSWGKRKTLSSHRVKSRWPLKVLWWLLLSYILALAHRCKHTTSPTSRSSVTPLADFPKWDGWCEYAIKISSPFLTNTAFEACEACPCAPM